MGELRFNLGSSGQMIGWKKDDITDALEKSPMYFNQLWREVQEKMAKNTLLKFLKELIAEGKIVKKNFKGHSWYFLSHDRNKWEELVGYGREPHIPSKDLEQLLQIRIAHTEDIKEKVIKPWLDKIPIICWDGVFLIGKDLSILLGGKEKGDFDMRPYYPKDDDQQKKNDVLPLEVDNILFSDFKENHVIDELGDNPFVLWDRFNSLSYEYWDKFLDFAENIASKFIESRYNVDYHYHCYKYLYRELIWILWKKALYPSEAYSPERIQWAEKDPPRGIKRFNVYYNYQIFLVSQWENKCRDDLKNLHSDKRILTLFTKHKDTIMALVNLLQEAKKIKDLLVEILNKYMHMNRLSGDCPYI